MNFTFVELLVYVIFPIIAIDYVIVYSEIFKPIRDRFEKKKLGYLLTCFICMSFWVGFLIGLCNVIFALPFIDFPGFDVLGWVRLVIQLSQRIVICPLIGISTAFLISLFIEFENKEDES